MSTVDLPATASSPTDVAPTAPLAVATSGAPAALPHASERPGHLLPLPKQGRGGDVRNAPHPPVPFAEHLLNRHHPVITPPYETPDGGEAA